MYAQFYPILEMKIKIIAYTPLAEAKNREKPSGLEINDILRWSYVPPEKFTPEKSNLVPYGMRCRCTARISSTGELRL
jgi:hypothetical protein